MSAAHCQTLPRGGFWCIPGLFLGSAARPLEDIVALRCLLTVCTPVRDENLCGQRPSLFHSPCISRGERWRLLEPLYCLGVTHLAFCLFSCLTACVSIPLEYGTGTSRARSGGPVCSVLGGRTALGPSDRCWGVKASTETQATAQDPESMRWPCAVSPGHPHHPSLGSREASSTLLQMWFVQPSPRHLWMS